MASYQIMNISGSDISINGENFTYGVLIDINSMKAIQNHEQSEKLKELIEVGEFEILKNNIPIEFGEALKAIEECKARV